MTRKTAFELSCLLFSNGVRLGYLRFIIRTRNLFNLIVFKYYFAYFNDILRSARYKSECTMCCIRII